jgi:hypothetical protein
MSRTPPDALPPYTYVPGGPWPHPIRDPQGHLHGRTEAPAAPIVGDDWESSDAYLRGFDLFNAGYYWEAHEAWEALWHAHGRTGAVAWIVQALIKLAAAGVKIRERRPAGVRTHATRAAALLERAREAGGRYQAGLDLDSVADRARQVADHPPEHTGPREARVARVFRFEINPRRVADTTGIDT